MSAGAAAAMDAGGAAAAAGPAPCRARTDSMALPSYRVGLLASGIDSIWLTVRGELRPGLVGELEELKERARLTRQPQEWEGSDYGGSPLYVQGYGRGGFRWLASSELVELEVWSGKPQDERGRYTGKPTVRARVLSDHLHEVGQDAAVHEVQQLLRFLVNAPLADVQVSEVHYHADVTGWQPGPGKWVKTVEEVHAVQVDCPCGCGELVPESVRFGEKGSSRLQLVAYNKTRELEKHDRPVLRELWRENGWRPGMQVWRVEARYSRDLLREYGIDSYAHLVAHADGLWQYATSWAREVHQVKDGEPCQDSNRRRWDATPGWHFVQGLTMGLPATLRKRVKDQAASAAMLSKQAAGCLASAAAKMRLGGLGLQEVFDVFTADAELGRIWRQLVDGFGEASAARSVRLGVAPLGVA